MGIESLTQHFEGLSEGQCPKNPFIDANDEHQWLCRSRRHQWGSQQRGHLSSLLVKLSAVQNLGFLSPQNTPSLSADPKQAKNPE